MKKRLTLFDNLKLWYLFAIPAVFCITPNKLYAQFTGVIKANPDNVFVQPGQTVFWNVLNNDDPGDCSYAELSMSILQPPTRATVCSVNAANQIRYRAVSGYWGKDSLVYQIDCKIGSVTTSSTAKVHININDKPDNVFTEVCHVKIPEIGWGIKEVAKSANIVFNASQIVCGDIDNDKETEIVVFGADPANPASATALYLLVFGVTKTPTGLQLNQKYRITLPANSANPYSTAVSIANVDGDGYSAIFYTTQAGSANTTAPMQLIKYRFNPGANSYYEEWRRSYSVNPIYSYVSPFIADFSATGRAQVQVYDKIYDASTGALLVNANLIPSSGNSTYSFGSHGHSYGSSAGTVWLSTCIAGDIDNDGKLELIGGDCVYKINITNHTGTSGNTFSLYKRATTRSDVKDGGTALVDLDLDGNLDVVVTSPFGGSTTSFGSVYAYNPRTGAVMNTNVINNIYKGGGANGVYGPSLPFVGDIDSDGRPEIAFTASDAPGGGGGVNSGVFGVLKTYKYNSGTLSPYWTVRTTDGSAATVLSLFDFKQSGEAQLVYRDEDSLRIINGENGKTLSYFLPVTSATVNEYPIIADVDKDGAAEIIAVGGDVRDFNGKTQWNWCGSVRIYAADTTGGKKPWAPARSIWNQRAYNPVYANNDLTVPRYPVNPATVFYDKDFGSKNRPFNNFLQQATMLNEEGEMLYLGPDLRFSSKRPTILYNTALDRLEITMEVGNDGDATFSPPLDIKTYVYDTPTNTFTLIHSTSENVSFEINEYKTITYYIPGYSSIAFPSYDHWMIFLNAKDNDPNQPTGFATLEECRFWNNYTSNVSFTYGERVMCEGRTEVLKLAPAGIYRYEWFRLNTDNTITPVPSGGDDLTVTKDADPVEIYLVNAYTKDGKNTLLTQVPDTAYVYLAPDSLVWTGVGKSGDWHNHENWFNPNAPVPNPYPRANIPRKCTDVLIPDNLSIYPDLSDLSTDYTDYLSECANIHFKHGGEVIRTDSLNYDAAYVELVLNGNRMYMLSAPLQRFYPGDYYISDPNPFKDKNATKDSTFVYTYLWSRTNPETAAYIDGNWTGAFNNPEIPITPGMGLGVWVDDLQPAGIHQPDTFNFPKHETTYTMYDRFGSPVGIRNTPRPVGTTPYGIAAPGEHMFIYEPVWSRSTGDIILDASATGVNKQTLVGNPFMSHLDFDKFYAMNSTTIMNYYRVMDENGNFITYTVGGTGTGTPPLSRYIAPMQSFLVTAKTGFSQLYANVEMMTVSAGEKLRSTSAEDEEEQILTIEIYRGSKVNKSLLILSPGSSNLYDGEEDVIKAFVRADTSPISVYTFSSDGILTDINRVGTLEKQMIPLGIRTSKKGSFRLNFGGLTAFAPDYDIYLNEISNGSILNRYNLREGSMHEFDKIDDEIFMNDRFYLSFEKNATAVSLPEKEMPKIEWAVTGNRLRIFTTDGSCLEEVSLYDLQGRLIDNSKNIRSSSTELPVASNRIYIIRATSETTSRSMKVYGKN